MAEKREPTPTEIAELCLLIQSTWAAAERMKRLRVDLRPHYQRCDGERLEMSSDDYSEHHEQRELINAIGT
jgi:hypothetical protein